MLNPPMLINGLAVSHNEAFFIFDFRADITLTYANNSQDIKEIHNVVLVPKGMIKTINEMISQNIKKYEKMFKKLEKNNEITEIDKKENKKESYFG